MMYIGVITILPEVVEAVEHGMVKKAIELGKIQLTCWNPRNWTERPQCQVDDTPYGGGPGMVMRYEPMSRAIEFAKSRMPSETKTIYLSPQGKRVTQEKLSQIAACQQPLLLVAGRYEGIDERLITTHVDEEWSLGDFVLSGGELAAMVFIDAISRLIPGVLGHPESAQSDSFMTGYLDFPHYTKPPVVNGEAVPEVLLSGNHANIQKWRHEQAIERTRLRRPDLLNKLEE